jgi:hypothetical protein
LPLSIAQRVKSIAAKSASDKIRKNTPFGGRIRYLLDLYFTIARFENK